MLPCWQWSQTCVNEIAAAGPIKARRVKERKLMDRFTPKTRKSGSWQAIVGVALSAFLLGALVVWYSASDGIPQFGEEDGAAEESETLADGEQDGGTNDPAPSPSPSESEPVTEARAQKATQAVERVEEQQGGLDQRLAAAEQRLARLDLQAQAASGNAARAEGLLIAFATRRTLERGDQLGYLADQLRLRFSDALPNAVNIVIETSRDPITIGELLARLEGLAPKLAETTEEPSFDRFKRELNELFVVRSESAPSPQPQRRLERARLFLESGRISSAIEEVESLPGAATAEGWIKDAKRYAAAQRALDVIETSAVLEPRRLRDRAGQPVEQPSPADENAAN